LTIPGTQFDQVNDLHQLSLDLKKKGLDPSQALLGISSFERLKQLGVNPMDLDRWSELVKTFAPADFPVKDFFESAARLYQLERDEGKSFEILTEEYIKLEEKSRRLRTETDSLAQEKGRLSEEVNSLTSQATNIKKTNEELQNNRVKLVIELGNL
jgi:hypothetical protein